MLTVSNCASELEFIILDCSSVVEVSHLIEAKPYFRALE